MYSLTSEYAKNVDSVMLYIIGISVVLLLIVTGSMIFFVVRYNHKKHPKAENIEGNTTIEIIWVVIPVLLVLSMFYYSFVTYSESRLVPPGALEIKVKAKMWAWEFLYPNGKISDTLFVPKGRPIKFIITSIDVNHSFYIPAFRIKEDAVPGRENYMVVTPKEVGVFDIACAEYCGLNHSLMYSKIYVVPENEFQAWFNGSANDDYLRSFVANHLGGYNEIAKSSYAILLAKGCVQCHSLDGRKSFAPSFASLNRGSAKVTINDRDTLVMIDKDYLRRRILHPKDFKTQDFENRTMPEFSNRLNEEEIDQIVDLLFNKFVKHN
ncbi:MAG: cytochrome c oxidase subunit II [Candidatus Kapaibacteriales bacterium]